MLRTAIPVIGPILWGHSGPLCHALSLLSLLLLLWTSILHCHSPGVATVARRLRYSYSWLRLILVVVSTVATPGEWQCKIRTGGVRRLAVANGPNIFQMLFVLLYYCWLWQMFIIKLMPPAYGWGIKQCGDTTVRPYVPCSYFNNSDFRAIVTTEH